MKPLYLLGIDGIGYHPLRRWIEQGKLPRLKEMCRKFNRKIQILDNQCLLRTENAWLTFSQALPTIASQEWAHCHYDSATYTYTENASYRFEKAKPFFRLRNCSSLVFDMPLVHINPDLEVASDVQRVEIYGWGTEANQTTSSSYPQSELETIKAKFPAHPVYSLRSDPKGSVSPITPIASPYDPPLEQYRLPNIYRQECLLSLRDGLAKGVQLRTEIISDLLQRHDPSLAICTYAEGHTAGHMFWHLSQPHPLHIDSSSDLLLDVLQEIDQSIGTLTARFPEADFIIFSPQGMQGNFIELSSSAFLPEIMYRFSRDGWLLGGDQTACQLINPVDYMHWRETVFQLINPDLRDAINSPFYLDALGDAMNWSPARWFQPIWPSLKAFALPSYSEGLIRLNVHGRDGTCCISEGKVTENEYESMCEEIISDLLQWRDVTTGKRIVAKVLRTRSNPWDTLGTYASLAADLVVQWREPVITNHICHPFKGEVGPLPYFRTGAHCHQGMVIDLSSQGFISKDYPGKLSLCTFAKCLESWSCYPKL